MVVGDVIFKICHCFVIVKCYSKRNCKSSIYEEILELTSVKENNKVMKKLVSGLLIFTCCFSLIGSTIGTMGVKAAEAVNLKAQQEHRGGYNPLPEEFEPVDSIYDNLPEGAENLHRATEDLPESYQTDPEYLPPVRDQNPTGTCWAHSALSLAEINLNKKGKTTNPALNFSEVELAYFSYNTQVDPLGLTEGDSNSVIYDEKGPNCYMRGGSVSLAKQILAGWVGAADEDEHGTHISSLPENIDTLLTTEENDADNPNGLIKPEYAYDDRAHLIGAYSADIVEHPDEVKLLIKEYGAVGIALMADEKYYNDETHCYYDYNPDDAGNSDHAVTIVGWDDTVSKDCFTGKDSAGPVPEGDGAWLIRNSWSDDDEVADMSYYKYFWLSYYDVSITREAFAYEFDFPQYDYNYQYDGAMHSGWAELEKGDKVSNVYKVEHKEGSESGEILKAVSLSTLSSNVWVRVDVCITVKDGENTYSFPIPEASTEANLVYPGYHTIELNSPVGLAEGDEFSIDFTVLSETAQIEHEYSLKITKPTDWYETVATIKTGQSYIASAVTEGEWRDYTEYYDDPTNIGNLRIKAFTSKPKEDEVIPASIVLVNNELNISAEQSDYITSYVLPIATYSQEVTYESENEAIATVSKDGLVTGVSEGETYVKVTAAGSELSTKCKIIVGPKEGGDGYYDEPSDKNTATYIFSGLEENYYYTGDAITPNFDLYYRNEAGIRKLLVKGTDYTVKYVNNKAPGTAKIIITAKGSYTGNIPEQTFTIVDSSKDKPQGSTSIKKNYIVSDIVKAGYAFTGEKIEPAVKIVPKKGEGAALKEGTDYTISYSNNIYAGKGTILITGVGEYCDSIKTSFKINPVNMTGNEAKYTVKADEADFNNAKGTATKLTVTYNSGDKDVTLKEGRDYTVKFANNKSVGAEATFTITGKGNFKGSLSTKTGKFKGDTKYKINSVSVNAIEAICVPNINVGAKLYSTKVEAYDSFGNKLKMSVVTGRDEIAKKKLDIGVIFTDASGAVYDKKYVAAEGDKITATIIGNGNYSGEKKVEDFAVINKPAADSAIANAVITKGVTYRANGLPVKLDAGKLTVTTKSGAKAVSALKENTDYVILYSNNVNKGNAIAIIKGIGDYTGYKTVKFKIDAQLVSTENK